MKPSRIVILSVALVAAGLAGLVAMQISGAKQVIEKRKRLSRKNRRSTFSSLPSICPSAAV